MSNLGPISPTQLAKVARRDWNRVIAHLAERQHGLVTLAQLTAIGMSASAVTARVRAGTLHRVHAGVFAAGSPRLHPARSYLAAVLACGPGSVISHRASAAHQRIRGSAATEIDVTSPKRTGRTRDGIKVHRADTLTGTDVTVVDGVPCTTVPRTILDLATVLPESALEYAIHSAQSKQLLRIGELQEALARVPRRRGTGAVRRILGLAAPNEQDAKSFLERRLLRLCHQARLPMPHVDRWIPLSEGHGLEVDFCWPEHRLVVETDGRTFHGSARAARNDPRRDRKLMRDGWRVARFTYRDVTETPGAVIAELRHLLTIDDTSTHDGPISRNG
jgi:very-short-patch-repair endonuclease